ncbi:hypothetical protein QJQ45_016121 [Haematococcus lacustris]|nr:hypothetical protein QJQ45_016121 [Haematococcus lacustris]
MPPKKNRKRPVSPAPSAAGASGSGQQVQGQGQAAKVVIAERRQVIKAGLRGLVKAALPDFSPAQVDAIVAEINKRMTMGSKQCCLTAVLCLSLLLQFFLGQPSPAQPPRDFHRADFSPATHIAVGVDPGVTQAIKAAHAMRDLATGQVLRQWEWELTKGQLKHDNGLTKAKQNTTRWSAAIQPQLQQLADATPAGTTLDSLHAHILALKATWDLLWEEYLKPRWRRQRLGLHHAQDRVIEAFCKKPGASSVITDRPVRGLMWCPVVAPRKPPCSSQEATQPAASEPGPSTPPPAKRIKRTKAELATEPTQPTQPTKAHPTHPATQPTKADDPTQPTEGEGKAQGCQNQTSTTASRAFLTWRAGAVTSYPVGCAQLAAHTLATGAADVMRIVRLVLEEAASVSQQRRGARKQLVFFGNAGIGTRGGWGAKAVLQACRKVVERPTAASQPTGWEHRGAAPAQSKEYPALGLRKLQDRDPRPRTSSL